MNEKMKSILAGLLFYIIMGLILYYGLFVMQLDNDMYEDEELQYYRVLDKQVGG